MRITTLLSTALTAVIFRAALSAASWVREPNYVLTLVGGQTLSMYFDDIGTHAWAQVVYQVHRLEPGKRLCISLPVSRIDAGYYSATVCHFNSTSKPSTFHLERTHNGVTTVLLNERIEPHDISLNDALTVGISKSSTSQDIVLYTSASFLDPKTPGIDSSSQVKYVDSSPQRITNYGHGFGLTVDYEKGARGAPIVNVTLLSANFDDPAGR